MDLEALKSRTTHTVSSAAATSLQLEDAACNFFCLDIDVNIYRCSLFDLLAGVRAIVQTGRHPGVDGGRGRVEPGAGASSAAAESHRQERQQGEGCNRGVHFPSCSLSV